MDGCSDGVYVVLEGGVCDPCAASHSLCVYPYVGAALSRASCERRVLRAARELVVRSARFSTMQDVAAFIKDTATSQ